MNFKDIFDPGRFDNVFTSDRITDQAKLAENQLKGAGAGFFENVVTNAASAGLQVMDLTGYLATMGSKFITRPAEGITSLANSAFSWATSSLQEIATNIPTNPMFYIDKAIKMAKSPDPMGRAVPEPNCETPSYTDTNIKNPFITELTRPLDSVVQKGKDLLKTYHINIDKKVNSANKWNSISYVVKSGSVSELIEKSRFNVFNKDGVNAGKMSLYGDVTLFDVMEYQALNGKEMFSCTLSVPKGGFAPAFKHTTRTGVATWLPLIKKPEFSHRELMSKGFPMMTDTIYYSSQLKKADKIDLEFHDNAAQEIYNYLANYRKAIFPDDNTYVMRPIKAIYSIFTYYIYQRPQRKIDGKFLAKAFQYAVIPEFKESYMSDTHQISFIVIGEERNDATKRSTSE